jgi:hypothetical protein
MVPDTRFGSSAVLRFEEHVYGAVELLACGFDVPEPKLFLPRLEMALRLLDQSENRVEDLDLGNRCKAGVRNGFRRRRMNVRQAGAASAGCEGANQQRRAIQRR